MVNSVPVTSATVVKVRSTDSGTTNDPTNGLGTVSLTPPSIAASKRPPLLVRLTSDASNAKSIFRPAAVAIPGKSLTPVWATLTTISVPDPATVPAVPPSPGTCVRVTLGPCAEACPANNSNAKAVVNKRLFFKNITNSSIENGIGKPHKGNFPIHRRIT